MMQIVRVAVLIVVITLARLTAYQLKPHDATYVWMLLIAVCITWLGWEESLN